MLDGLQDFVNASPSGDILIVLHQMGNHGPAYFKRYPPEFEVFKPVCSSVALQSCSVSEITNAYDNAIRYTDHFLAQAITFLRANDSRFETAFLYVSDHGESLGEQGVYLHGLPTLLAPLSQIHVPMFLWFGENYHGVDRDATRDRAGRSFTHDNLFHTVLGLFEIETSVYDPAQDVVVHTEYE
jgi:lipid A ethanolaminephosphotransferase